MTDPPAGARPPPWWLFGILVLPFGAAVGYLQVAAPFWLRNQGLSLEEIGALSATAFLPHALKLLWIPLLDAAFTRKAWYVTMVAATAALLGGVSLVDPKTHLGLFTALVTAAQATAATSSAALDALMAITTTEAQKGRAAGFYMAGAVGWTGLLGAAAIWLAQKTSPAVAGLSMAGAVVCAGAGVFVLHEPILETAQAAAGWLGAMGRRFLAIVRDLWQTVKTKEALTGVVICAAPVGCGALVNLFTALAPDYHAPAEVVGLVNGLGGGLAGALGSVVGGFFADRMNRRLAYAAAGGLTALCALGFYLGPMNETTFTLGSLAYAFANGLAFAAFAGMVLEMVGHSAAVTTKYTLFVAVSNQAISYTTWFDGKASGFRGWGSRGTILADALVTFAGIGLLLAMVALTRRRGPERPSGQNQGRKDG